jgi:hypothetical protein
MASQPRLAERIANPLVTWNKLIALLNLARSACVFRHSMQAHQGDVLGALISWIRVYVVRDLASILNFMADQLPPQMRLELGLPTESMINGEAVPGWYCKIRSILKRIGFRRASFKDIPIPKQKFRGSQDPLVKLVKGLQNKPERKRLYSH